MGTFLLLIVIGSVFFVAIAVTLTIVSYRLQPLRWSDRRLCKLR